MANSTSNPAIIMAKDDNSVSGQHKQSQNHRSKQTNKNQKRQNRQSRYDHSNDHELNIIESQLKNGKKVKGSKSNLDQPFIRFPVIPRSGRISQQPATEQKT